MRAGFRAGGFLGRGLGRGRPFLVVDFLALALRALDFFAPDLRALDFLAPDLRALDFLAPDLRALDFFAPDLRALVFLAVDFLPGISVLLGSTGTLLPSTLRGKRGDR